MRNHKDALSVLDQTVSRTTELLRVAEGQLNEQSDRILLADLVWMTPRR